MTEIIRFMRDVFQREISAGVPLPQASATVERELRNTFAGERVYIAGYPKQRRAVQLAKMQKMRTIDMAVATGLSVRRVRQIVRGK